MRDYPRLIIALAILQPAHGLFVPNFSQRHAYVSLERRTVFLPVPLAPLNRRTPVLSSSTKTEDDVTTPAESTDIDFSENNPDVVCARGVCVIADDDFADELCHLQVDAAGDFTGEFECVPNPDAVERNVFSVEFLWPRALLLGCSLLYGTNFPLGRIMNDALPASATTSGRMLLAAIALSPFLLKLKPELRVNAVIGGSFCALGYLSQSVALLDVPAATVAFLGALVVIVTPLANVLIGNAKLGFKDAPQTWIGAILCLVGVGTLELGGGGGLGELGAGDVWSVLQAVGFGTAFYFTEGMMAKNPGQALPITAVQVGMAAFYSAIWAILDGTGSLGGFGGDNGAWLLDEITRASYAIPGLFLSGFAGDETLKTVAAAAVWTGLITTAGNRVCETTALGKVSSSEAAVLLATEPLWAALFASFWIGETLGPEDFFGGALITVACVITALKPETIQNFLGIEKEEKEINGFLNPVSDSSPELENVRPEVEMMSSSDTKSFP